MIKNIKKLAAFFVGLGSCLTAFSIETSDRPISLGLISSGVYFILLSTEIRKIENIGRKFGSFYLLPLGYLLILWVTSIIYASVPGTYFPVTFFLNWLLMVFVLLHSYSDSKAPDYILNGIAIAAIFMAILFYMGVGVEIRLTNEGERLTMFDVNVNDLSIIQSIGFAILLNKGILRNDWNLPRLRFLLIIPALMEVSMVLLLASRTGTIIIGAVLMVSILTIQGLKQSTKLSIETIGILLISYGVYHLFQGDSMIASRLSRFIDEGDTNGRTDIWMAYLHFYPEHPIFGVGSTGMMDLCVRAHMELVDHYGNRSYFSPHNVLVEILMTTGFLGLFFMLRFWYKTYQCAINAYRKKITSLSLVLCIPIVITILSGQILANKIAWITYSYMIVMLQKGNRQHCFKT